MGIPLPCKEVRRGSCVSPTQAIYPQDCSKSFHSSFSSRHSNDRQGMAFIKVWMAPCSYQCHAEEEGSHCSFSNSFGTRVSMGLATAPRTHVTKSVLESIARSPETLKKMGWNNNTRMFHARIAEKQKSWRVEKSDRNATAVCAACT